MNKQDPAPFHPPTNILSNNSNPRRSPLAGSSRLVLGVLLGVAMTAIALGPLNPPSGGVTSTHKTLTEIEPRIAINDTNTPGTATSIFKITQPGSYYLTGNVTGVGGKNGVEIAASGVTLDLNGFELAGVPGAGGSSGVMVTNTSSNIAVLNGSVRNWDANGIMLLGALAVRVEGVRASAASVGIFVGPNSIVSKCTTSGGVFGVYALQGSTITECTATGASNTGISGDFGLTISSCSSTSNGGSGFVTSYGCTISNCTAYSNGGTGFGVGLGSTISSCTAILNLGRGITADDGCTVSGCTALRNKLDGILVSGNCTVRGNACDGNGTGSNGDGAGIHVTGTDNRIEGNNCTGADRGIDVDANGNFIARNTCSGNTVNWDVVAGNVIVVVLVAPAGAVLGNSGGVPPGSTDPNANFSY